MRLTRSIPLLAAAAASLTVATAPAAATPALGVLEHRVFEVYDVSPAAGDAQHSRGEHFVARGRDRAVISDRAGRVTFELTKNGTDLRNWDADTNVLTVTDHGIPGTNFTLSRADDAANMRRLIADGTYRVTGDTTWNGRAAVTATVAAAPDRPGHVITHVLDAGTKQLLETTERAPDGTVTFSRKVLVDEDLPLNATTDDQLEMSSHPGAIVRATTAKHKKAKAKRKAAAKRKAKSRRR